MNEKKIDREKIWRRIEEIRANDTNPELLRELLDDWDRDYGPEYNSIVEEILAEVLSKNAAEWAKDNNVKHVDDIVVSMWERWAEGEFTIDRTEQGIQIYCTKCPHADAYRSIGRADYGLLFKCSEDPHIVTGANPKFKFRRTKTLMNGDNCCDHFYSME